MGCKTCNDRGLVLVDLWQLRLCEAAVQFLSAGTRAQQDERGSTRHEMVCPECDGGSARSDDLTD